MTDNITDLADSLVAEANNRGGRDNISLMLVVKTTEMKSILRRGNESAG